MKRREFMRLINIGIGGLVGLERLARAMVGDPAYANTSCDGQGTSHKCYQTFSCTVSGVICSGNRSTGYAFECQDYECSAGFTCSDYVCKESRNGDFNCTSGFTCKNPNNGQRFDCQGSDPLDAQFNCKIEFECKPGTEFGCDDFHYEEGNFFCAASPGSLPIAFALSIQPNAPLAT